MVTLRTQPREGVLVLAREGELHKRERKAVNSIFYIENVKCSFNYTTILYLLYLYGNSISKLEYIYIYIYMDWVQVTAGITLNSK